MTECVVQTPGISGSLTPSGLTIGGLHTPVVLTFGSWLPLPATALTDRNALGIQNFSGNDILVNFSNVGATTIGLTIRNNAERYYDITESIILYATPVLNQATTVLIEELA